MSTELRQRKGGASDPAAVPLLSTSPESQTPNRNRSLSNGTSRTTGAGGAMSSLAAIQQYFVMISPYVAKIQSGFETLLPYLHAAYEKYLTAMKILEPYRVDLLLPAFLGLVLCFFGGTFMTLVAAAEAYRMCGYENSVKCIEDLVEDFRVFEEANSKDNAEDKDGDGVADVKQIGSQELATRKTLLFLKTVDPGRLTTAIAGLNSGLLAVIATLKLQFAKSITLGNAIGDIAKKPSKTYIIPALEAVMPAEYKRWAEPLVMYMIKSLCISMAWFLQRIISAVHSAIRGGVMVSRNLLEYLSKMGYLHINHEETFIDEIVGYGLAVTGLWFQLSTGMTLPFPLNIILLPFSLVEYFLMWMVAS